MWKIIFGQNFPKMDTVPCRTVACGWKSLLAEKSTQETNLSKFDLKKFEKKLDYSLFRCVLFVLTMAEMSEEEEFATKVFQNLILPRGPVSSVKIRTFKKFLSEGEKWSKFNKSYWKIIHLIAIPSISGHQNNFLIRNPNQKTKY